MSGKNLPRINLIRGKLFTDKYLLPMTVILTAVAFVVLCGVACVWITGVNYISRRKTQPTCTTVTYDKLRSKMPGLIGTNYMPTSSVRRSYWTTFVKFTMHILHIAKRRLSLSVLGNPDLSSTCATTKNL